jgi:hypothetical protein
MPRPTEDPNVRNTTLLAYAIAITTLVSSGSAHGQREAAAAEPAPTPRLADGTVDLGGDGIWDQPWITDFGRQLVGGPDAQIPFLPWTKAMYDYNKSTQVAYDPQGFCLPPGGPRMFGTPYPSEFIQDRDRLVVIFEGGAHVWREIHMDGRPLPKREELNPTYFGYSVGRWEGDTLVVETRNLKFNEQSRFGVQYLNGISDENLRVIERFTRIDAETIMYRATIEDPTIFTRPWTVEIPLTPSEGPLFEVACHEGNYGLANILSGHRAEERAAGR